MEGFLLLLFLFIYNLSQSFYFFGSFGNHTAKWGENTKDTKKLILCHWKRIRKWIQCSEMKGLHSVNAHRKRTEAQSSALLHTEWTKACWWWFAFNVSTKRYLLPLSIGSSLVLSLIFVLLYHSAEMEALMC